MEDLSLVMYLVCSTLTISNRYTTHAPHLATMFPRKGRAPPAPITGMGGVVIFAIRSVMSALAKLPAVYRLPMTIACVHRCSVGVG